MVRRQTCCGTVFWGEGFIGFQSEKNDDLMLGEKCFFGNICLEAPRFFGLKQKTTIKCAVVSNMFFWCQTVFFQKTYMFNLDSLTWVSKSSPVFCTSRLSVCFFPKLLGSQKREKVVDF